MNRCPPQLRIVHWGTGAPDRACCTECGRVFAIFGMMTSSTIAEARDALEFQFRNHRCPSQPVRPGFSSPTN